MSSPESEHWEAALNADNERIDQSNVSTQVHRPKYRKVVDTKLVFMRKVDADEAVKRHKCRFLAQGFRSVEGLDHTENYAPTPATASARMVLAIAAMEDLELDPVDVE
ncbi:unnamed protein product [Discosporangium mesarthrocarpum]